MNDDITLPPLPPHRLGERWPHHVVWGYEDMVAFARAAILLDREKRDKPAPSAEPPPAALSGEEEVTRLVRWLTAPRAKGAK
jgi:hypothetical protein